MPLHYARLPPPRNISVPRSAFSASCIRGARLYKVCFSSARDYESDAATGPYSQPATSRPDMYVYLREDIKIVAGLLANLDRCFARKRFRPGERLEDSDPSWQFGLADLGHALHGVEDFFAHSDFVELAAQVLGADYQPDGSVTTNKLLNPNYTAFQKRLRRWDIKEHASWIENAAEDRIVTGYFDGVDTMFSLVGAVIDLWGIEPIDPLQSIREWRDEALDDWKEIKRSPKEFLKKNIATPAEQRLRNALDYFSDRKTATQDPDNEFAKNVDKKLKQLGRFDEPAVSGEVMKSLLSDPSFSRLSPKMRGCINDYFNVLNRGVGGVAQLARSTRISRTSQNLRVARSTGLSISLRTKLLTKRKACWFSSPRKRSRRSSAKIALAVIL